MTTTRRRRSGANKEEDDDARQHQRPCCCCSSTAAVVLMDVGNLIHHRQPITTTSSTRSLLLLPLLLLLLTLLEAESIRLEHVEVPSVVAVGEPAAFLCDVDLEFDNELYSVKWYKDSEEFYEWKPKRTPSVQIYPVEGIQVDRERSVREAVVLRSVTPATAGFFRCEASGEGPAFRSVSGGAALSVVILPKKKPAIFGGYVINEQDGTVELNCTTDPSRPAAQIRWLINNVPVNPELIQETSISRTSSGLETSFSVLELQSRDHFPRSGKSSGALKGSSSSNTATVTCEAAIPYSTQKAAAAPSMSSVTYWSTLSSSSTYSNGGSNAVAESAHQFQRRIASDSHQHGERIFRSRHVASAETLQSLTLRTEILIYVNSGRWAMGSILTLFTALMTSYCLS
ncbi:uncharacterized protein LOC124311227 isoform X2 [Daphnia pulicaria]|uniref:uncharacterized protein LOC124311227 isoform X2 n=1 Tax=Daphnia pulicaria TaxID=35523 RepID=UPI001EECA914|nr:uncharacterized protein LOC124311227 isoform X2 [Daphnia pulicaria]